MSRSTFLGGGGEVVRRALLSSAEAIVIILMHRIESAELARLDFFLSRSPLVGINMNSVISE